MASLCPCFSRRSTDAEPDPAPRLITTRPQSRASNRRVSFALPRSQSISSNLRLAFAQPSTRSSRAPSIASATEYPPDEKRREDFFESQSIYTHTTSTVSLPSNGFTETTENTDVPPPPYSPPRTPSPFPDQSYYASSVTQSDGGPSTVRFQLPSDDEEEEEGDDAHELLFAHPPGTNTRTQLYRRSLAPSYDTINMVSGIASAAAGAIGAGTGAAALHYAWQDRRQRQAEQARREDLEMGMLPPSPPPAPSYETQDTQQTGDVRPQAPTVHGQEEGRRSGELHGASRPSYEHVWTGMR